LTPESGVRGRPEEAAGSAIVRSIPGEGIDEEACVRRSRETNESANASRCAGSRERGKTLCSWGFLLGFVLISMPGGAEEGTEPPAERLVVPGGPSGPPGEGAPGLDALLSVPKDYLEPRGRTVGGAGEDEWRRRFARAHETLQGAQAALEETKGALDNAAEGSGSSQWAVAPPGAGGGGSNPTDSPLSYKLRQDLVRNRERLEAAERALRDLRIEADLAGVPPDWRDDRKVPLGKRLPDSPYYN